MTLVERTEWLMLGAFIGFVLGYIVGRLRDIKEELDEVKTDTKQLRKRDERGIMTHRMSANISLFIVVVITLFAAIQSQRASNKSNDTADRILQLQQSQKQTVDCLTQVLFADTNALNERTTYSTEQADANIDLVQAQLDLITKGSNPNVSDSQGQALLDDYVQSLKTYLKIARQSKDKLVDNPFPTVADLATCLTKPSGKKE